jgi:SAM-dependent methyltransferase
VVTGANSGQIEYWNSDETGRHWVEHETRYDAMLKPYSEQLLAAVSVTSAERVVDIGCGFGTTTLAAAAAARDGDALGVDISRWMLDRARERAREQGIHNARFEIADAQVVPFDAMSRDVAISRFGVMFFADPVAAFANIRTAFAPAGRLAFVCWQDVAANDWVMVPTRAAAAHVALPDPGEPGAPGPFALGDADRVRTILTEAGYREIEIDPITNDLLLAGGGDVDEAVEFLRGTGAGRRPWPMPKRARLSAHSTRYGKRSPPTRPPMG